MVTFNKIQSYLSLKILAILNKVASFPCTCSRIRNRGTNREENLYLVPQGTIFILEVFGRKGKFFSILHC